MARNLVLNLILDPARFIRGEKAAIESTHTLNRAIASVGVNAEKSTQAQIAAAVKRDDRLRREILTIRQLSTSYAKGSREQIVAANLLIEKERQLARSIGATAAETRIHTAAANANERALGRTVRGALAGSGVFHSLGRSLAFASGGFLAFASGATLIRRSVEEATKAAAIERSLAQQFKVGNLNLADYNDTINKTVISTSRLSGFTRDDLLQSFLRAFRGTREVNAGLLIMQASANAARASGKGLDVVTLALTKAFLGQTGAARRLGILLPAHAKSYEALRFVIARYAGQAQAATTPQERFAAAVQLTQVSIGRGLLPAITDSLVKGSAWLLQQENQERIQRDVSKAVKDGTVLLKGMVDILKVGLAIVSPFVKALGGLENVLRIAGGLFVANKVLKWAAAIRESRLALFALGAQAPKTAGAVVAAEEEMGAASVSLGKKLGKLGVIFAGIQLATQPEQTKKSFLAGGPIGIGKQLIEQTTGLKGTSLRVATDISTLGLAEAFGLFQKSGKPKQLGDELGNELAPSFIDLLSEAVTQLGSRITQATVSGKLGFKARFADAELKLAQAQLTTQQADDRRVLVVEARLIEERIKRLGNARATLEERTSLTQQLAGIEGQITQIDQQSFQNTIRFKQLELQLAQAQLTATQADDRKVLEAQSAAIRSRLATIPKTKATLDARTQLTQQLAGIEGQIAGIDQAAKQKQLDALDKQKQAATQQLQKIRQRENDLRTKIKQITDQLTQTIDTVRGQIGTLFSGSVLQPTPEQIKAKLGVKFENVDPNALTKDLRSQVQQFAAFERDLARLAKRGAPKELLKELQAQGIVAAPEVAALARAAPGELKAFFKAFRARERLAITTAKTEMKAQLVNLHADRVALGRLRQQEVKVEIDVRGINRRQVKVRRTTTATGRTAGR